MFGIMRSFMFEAAHALDLPYASDCKFIHGHSYKVEVGIFAEKLNDEGMVADFKELSAVEAQVKELWDHKLIVSGRGIKDSAFARIVVFNDNPTAENMAFRILQMVKDQVFKDFMPVISGINVRVWETEKNSASCSWRKGE